MTSQPASRRALASLSLSMLMPSLDTSIANVALPSIAQAFGLSFSQVLWIVLANLLALTSIIVSAGRIGDTIGRKRLLLFGIGLFTSASLLSGFAPTFGFLVAARAMQGIGAAILLALVMSLAGTSALGLLGALSAIGTSLGPPIGGAIIAAFGWRMIFFVNLPLGLLTAALAYRYLPIDETERTAAKPSFDVIGAVLLALTLAAYVLAMTMNRQGLTLLNAALFMAAAGALALLVRVESRKDSPLIPLCIFRNPSRSAGLAMSTLVSTVLMATLVVGPFYLSRGLGLPPAQVGLAMSIGPLVAALAGLSAGAIIDRLGVQRMTRFGLIGMAGGLTLLSILPLNFGVPGYITPIALVTASYALFQTANNTTVMTGVAASRRGVLSGMLTLSRNLGLITGAAVMGALFAYASGAIGNAPTPPPDVARGMRVTFAAGLALIAAALAVAAKASSASTATATAS
ncbi:MAG: MFS transporter [Bryobacteraceae bacterium]